MDKRKNDKGITLMVLVITIIVMLLLSAISINAAIGDNGIISKARNAAYLNYCAIIEDWLRSEYVLNKFDDEDNENELIDYLLSQDDNILYLSPYGLNYVFRGDDGEGVLYYLIDKAKLPEKISKQINGGDAIEYDDYYDLQDVYGITPELKVYYLDSEGNVIGSLGNVRYLDYDDKSRTQSGSAIAEVFGRSEEGITIKELLTRNDLILDGNRYKDSVIQKAIDKIIYANNLNHLEIKNCTLENLKGIAYLKKLDYLYLDNVYIDDYSGIDKLDSLTKLYIYNFDDGDFVRLMSKINQRGKPYDKLAYLYIKTERKELGRNITDLSPFYNNENLCSTIQYLGINEEKLSNNSHIDFTNLKKAIQIQLSNIRPVKYDADHKITLDGFSSLNNILKFDCAYSYDAYFEYTSNFPTGCPLNSIYISGFWDSLDMFSNCKDIVYMSGLYVKYPDFEGLKNCSKLVQISCFGNYNLEKIDVINNFPDLDKFEIASSTKITQSDVDEVYDILSECTTLALPNGMTLQFFDGDNLYFKDEAITLSSLKRFRNNNKIKIVNFENVKKYLKDNGTEYDLNWNNDGNTIDAQEAEDIAKVSKAIEDFLIGLPSLEEISLWNQSFLTDISYLGISKADAKARIDALIQEEDDAQNNSSNETNTVINNPDKDFFENVFAIALNKTKITDLTVLNDHLDNLETVNIGLSNIAFDEMGNTLSKCQPMIEKCFRVKYDENGNIVKDEYGQIVPNYKSPTITAWSEKGVCIYDGYDSVKALERCTSLTKMRITLHYTGLSTRWQTDPIQAVNLTNLSNLEHLHVIKNYYYTNSSLILPENITDLRLISQRNNDPSYHYSDWLTYTDISRIKHLDCFKISSSNFSTVLSKIPENKKLKVNYLWIEGIEDEQIDLSKLDITDTNYFYMNYNNDLRSIKGIGTIDLCKYFYISNSNKLVDIELVESANSLTKIQVCNNNALSNIDFIKNMSELTYIDAYNNAIFDLYAIKDLNKLAYLYVQNNKIQKFSTILIDNQPTVINSLQIVMDLNWVKGSGALRWMSLKNNNFTEKEIKDSGITDSSYKWGSTGL